MRRVYNNSLRIIRGGSWHDSASYRRSAIRYYGLPDGSGGNLGFRVALVRKGR